MAAMLLNSMKPPAAWRAREGGIMSPVIVMSPEDVRALVVLAVKEAIPDKPADRVEKRLLTGQDVEKEYGIPRRTLERWRMDGTGPTYTPMGGEDLL